MTNKKSHHRRWVRTAKVSIARAIKFVTYGMWRMSDDDMKGRRVFFFNALKSSVLTGRGFIEGSLAREASALTYSTVLSIVPILAVIVGIAKGFGLQGIVYKSLQEYLPGHHHELQVAFDYVENYLSQIQSGLFLGLGLLILLYTVINLVFVIESSFNRIWQVPRGRSLSKQIVNYLAFFLLVPILITVSSGLTIMMGTLNNTLFSDYIFIRPLLNNILNLAPYVVVIFTLTMLYMWLPNTRVKFFPALKSGIIAGIIFQIFQFLYVNGVLWISRYNAIYGSFAAFPLLLLWINFSWTIVLLGAQHCYSLQNVDSFVYVKESSNVSRRYLDFVTIMMMTKITKRFWEGEKEPYMMQTLAQECNIPYQLANQVIRLLLRADLIIEVNYPAKKEYEIYYQPNVAPQKLTVGLMMNRLDKWGMEGFRIDHQGEFKSYWEVMKQTRRGLEMPDADRLLVSL